MARTNNEIIREAVESVFTADQIHELAAAHFTAEQIAARAAGLTVTDKDGNELDPAPFAELELVADQFHTFQEWKRLGLSVKKGEKAAIKNLSLWRYTDKPNAAARKAAEDAGEEINPDPHFYKAPAHLFFISQVERRSQSAERKPADVAGYNRYLMAQRRAGNKTPLSMAEWAAQNAQPAAEAAPAKTTRTKAAAAVTAAPALHKKPAGRKASTKKAAAKPAAAPAPAPAAEPDFAALAAAILF